jgi:hypothetical protein
MHGHVLVPLTGMRQQINRTSKSGGTRTWALWRNQKYAATAEMSTTTTPTTAPITTPLLSLLVVEGGGEGEGEGGGGEGGEGGGEGVDGGGGSGA